VCTVAETRALVVLKPLCVSQALSHYGALLCEEKGPVPLALHGGCSQLPDPHMERREIGLADAVPDPVKHQAGLLLGILHRLLRLACSLLYCLLGRNSRCLDLLLRLPGDALCLEQRVDSH